MRLILLVGALVCCAAASPAPQPTDASLRRLVRSFDIIRDDYVQPIEMAPLADAALEAVRKKAGLDDMAWARCNGTEPAKTSGPVPAELANVARAIRCADQASGSEPIASAEITDVAIEAMVAKLDEKTHWFTVQELEKLSIKNTGLASVGLTLKRRDNGFVVVASLANAPAGQAGIAPGDSLIAIDGTTTAGLPFSDVIDKLRGSAGSPVKLTVQTEKSPSRDIELVRKVIPAIESSLQTERKGSVLIVHLHGLPVGIADTIKERVNSEGSGATSIILDLRDNPGGLLDQAIAVADLFLDKAVIVTSRGRTERDVETYWARKGQVAPGLPMIVLANRNTAAGAEIIASSLQDNKRAIVLGEKTFAAGSVQTLMPIDGGYALRLTTSFEYRANGQRLVDAPVLPDCQGSMDPAALLDYAVTLSAKTPISCSKTNEVAANPRPLNYRVIRKITGDFKPTRTSP